MDLRAKKKLRGFYFAHFIAPDHIPKYNLWLISPMILPYDDDGDYIIYSCQIPANIHISQFQKTIKGK